MKKTDVILLFCALALAAILFAVCFAILGGKGEVAVVTVDGEEYARLPLDTDTELLITTDGGENLLVVENGKVYMREADCPDRTCVKTGYADEMKSIVCLPHRVTVTVEEE